MVLLECLDLAGSFLGIWVWLIGFVETTRFSSLVWSLFGMGEMDMD